MTYEEFVKFVQSKCMHEIIYEDSQGRSILVINLLDAYGMVNKAIKEEREACAKVCDSFKVPAQVRGAHPDYLVGKEMAASQLADAIRARGQE